MINPPGEMLRTTFISLIQRDGRNLSANQMGVFLTCYLRDTPRTVRGLAQELNTSKPVISRALDRLAALGLVKRKADPVDRRSVLVARTKQGQTFMRALNHQAKMETAS